MNLRTVLAAAAVLAVSTPALAQETPAQPPAAAQPTPAQAAFMAREQAFRADLDGMFGELRTVLQDASTDAAQKRAAVDAILTSHTPRINTFADDLNAFLVAERAASSDPAEQAEIDAAIAAGPANVRGIPAALRAQIDQAITEAEAEAAAGAAAGGQPVQPGSGAVAGEVPVQ